MVKFHRLTEQIDNVACFNQKSSLKPQHLLQNIATKVPTGVPRPPTRAAVRGEELGTSVPPGAESVPPPCATLPHQPHC